MPFGLDEEKNVKPFSLAAAFLLGLVALMQLVRLVLGWPVIVNGASIPLWPSAIACLVLAGLAVMVWREARR